MHLMNYLRNTLSITIPRTKTNIFSEENVWYEDPGVS